ncbi:RNA polymerase sigma factor [Robertkochia aurantiaca]|uniref:RNA polymerase sigma factor n=1 Tax=Robertkochia aurantiaca TaxID=2873700 RepID=UPI001CCE2DF0|nr:RNA polymerase sigma factor [Robertkochia sp. 3YJGBD-33]
MFQVDLIEKCKDNDRRAQMQLYDQYCDGMFCVAMRFMENADDAKDATQEAFIKAFQKIHQYRAEVTFGAWLKRIVINKCIDHLKSRKQYLISLDEGYLQVADETDDWNVESDISLEEVKQAIADLPEKYRYVVMLYLIEGYDHDEISEILNITNVSSRTQLMRGRMKLKELLKNKRNGTRP